MEDQEVKDRKMDITVCISTGQLNACSARGASYPGALTQHGLGLIRRFAFYCTNTGDGPTYGRSTQKRNRSPVRVSNVLFSADRALASSRRPRPTAPSVVDPVRSKVAERRASLAATASQPATAYAAAAAAGGSQLTLPATGASSWRTGRRPLQYGFKNISKKN